MLKFYANGVAGSHVRRANERKQEAPRVRSVFVMLKIGLSLPFLATVSRVALAEKAGLIKTQGRGSSAGWLWTYVCSPVLLF